MFNSEIIKPIPNSSRSLDRTKYPPDYLEEFNLAKQELLRLVVGSENPMKLEYDKDGLIGYDRNGSRLKSSKSFERKCRLRIKTQETKDYFTNLLEVDFENMSEIELSKFMGDFKIKTQTEFEKTINYKNQFEKMRSSKRNIFELDTSSPEKFATGLLGVLDPEEAADFMLLLIFQMWARVTNSPKIPGVDVYTDFIEKIGIFEANPITANQVYKDDANRLNEQLGNTPWRSNDLQNILKKINDNVYEERGCEGEWVNGRLVFSKKDLFVDVKVPCLNSIKFLPNVVKQIFQIREYSRAEIAYKARLIKLVELAYEKGMVHALTNHISGSADVLGVFSDVLGISNPFAGKPAHK